MGIYFPDAGRTGNRAPAICVLFTPWPSWQCLTPEDDVREVDVPSWLLRSLRNATEKDWAETRSTNAVRAVPHETALIREYLSSPPRRAAHRLWRKPLPVADTTLPRVRGVPRCDEAFPFDDTRSR